MLTNRVRSDTIIRKAMIYVIETDYEGTEDEPIRVVVYDPTGRTIYSTEKRAPFSDQVDLQQFSKGLKIVKAQSGNTVVIERIILE